MSSGYESDDEPMCTDILKCIRDGSQSHPIVNSRESSYKIRDHILKIQAECKGALISTRNMGKVLHKVFKSVVN